METTQDLHYKSNKNAFDKKVLSVIQQLYPYVKHRLYIAGSVGILPKNMYSTNGIIDEAMAKLYENGFDQDADISSVKLGLFKIVTKDLDDLFKKEAFHKKTLSTDFILKDELDSLEETFTVDEDFEYIMSEELNDISYKQNNDHDHEFLYDIDDSTILNAFEVRNISPIINKKFLSSLYSKLPIKVSDIIDLYVFGKLNYEEISRVKQIEESRVKKIFKAFNKRFKKN